MTKRFFIFFLFLVITLFLRDLPYVNIFVINKIWIIYILLFLLFVIPSFSQKHLLTFAFLLLPVALILTLFNFVIASEVVGVIIYTLLVGVVVFRLNALTKKR